MSEEHNDEHKSHGMAKLAIAGVAAASAAVTYFLYGPKADENRAKLRGWMLKAKGEIMEELEELEDVTMEKYEEIVDRVMVKYYEYKGENQESVDAFKARLKEHASEIIALVKEKLSDAEMKLDDAEAKVEEM